MSRQKFLDYIRHGDVKPFVSLQIGAGSGFDCKLAGKEWISEGTISDTIKAYEIVGGDAFMNVGLPGFDGKTKELTWHSKLERYDGTRQMTRSLETPYGIITQQTHERPMMGVTPVAYPLTINDATKVFDIVNWYAEQHFRAVKYVPEMITPLVKELQPHGPVCIQWNVQPFELMGLASVDNLVLLVMTYPEQYRRTCDLIRDVNVAILKQVFVSGADFIFLGAPGSEMLSPQIYEEFIIPDSAAISQTAHQFGGLIYSHICSPVEPFLSSGYYNRMGIDLFETLSSPPVGNVDDLGSARRKLDPKICTRGNIGLDVLLKGTPDEVVAETERVLAATRGFKHIVAASDYLFYDIPLENAKAVIDTVRNYV